MTGTILQEDPAVAATHGRLPSRRTLALVFLVLVAVLLGPSQIAPSTPSNPVRYPTADPTGYAATCLAVGVAVNGGETALSRFRRAQEELGPLTIRRSFDATLPASFQQSAAAGDPAAGLRSFVSWKPPNGDHTGAAEGRYDRQITAWAKSVPRTGVYATAWHEPENNMTAQQYVAFERHVYSVVKAANPTILFGPVYMAYWWEPGQRGHFVGDPRAWWPGDGYADFAGIDWYGPNPEPMTASASFRLWYRTMEPTGVPLFVTEYGQGVQRRGEAQDPARDAARVQAMKTDAAWIAAHPRIRMWLYWQNTGAQGDWRLKDPASQAEWRRIADSGCRS